MIFDDANCNGYDTEAFYPLDSDHAATKAAKAICKGCPALDACLEFAMRSEAGGLRHGIFAGMTPQQRYRLASKEAVA